MDLQDPKIQKLLIASILSVGVLYLFFGTTMMGFTYPSQKAELAELTAEHERLSRELERARLIVGNMAKLERESEYLHRQWAVAQKLLPEENEISPTLRQITAAGSQAGLAWVRFEPVASVSHGFYTENPVEVEVEGAYHQVGNFVSALANLNRIINVRNLKLDGVRPMDQSDPEQVHTVTASMQVVAYSMSSLEAAGADMQSGGTPITQNGNSAGNATASSAAQGGQ